MGTGFIDRVLVQVKEERKKGRKEDHHEIQFIRP